MKNFKRATFSVFLASAITVSASGCSPTVNVRGNIVKDYQLSEVVPGEDSRTDVLKKLGSPTTKATFDENIWYYMGQETEKKGILDPKVTEERIIKVSFNDEGIVDAIEDVNSDRVNIPIDRDKTPTSGNEITIMQQFLGNLGRFNPPQQE